MRPNENSTTRREFFKNAAIGAAGIGIMGSPAATGQEPKGGSPPAPQEGPRGVLPHVPDGSKHGHLIKRLNLPAKPNYNHPKMPGNNDAIAWPRGNELEGADINLSWGHYSQVGLWQPWEPGGHYHPTADELLIFVGLDANRPEYLGAECEFDVGREYERHLFRVPTICCFPKNFVHLPQYTLKSENAFAFIVCSLEGAHETVELPDRSILETTEGHKYDHLFKKMVFRRDIKVKTGPGNADALAWHMGKDLEGFNANFAFGFYSATGDWGAKPHKHVSDQFLAFVGLDDKRPNYLGAEIEISLGEEQEKHVIDVPSIVICSAGFTHGPIVTKKVDRPFGFYSVRKDKGDDSETNPA
jgi:hypothetical protein